MSAHVPDLQTSRLILRTMELADAPAVQAVFPQWSIVRFLSTVPWPYPADGAETFIRGVVLPEMEQETAWHWSIRLLSAPERLIGMISLRDKQDDNRGFWLDPAWQGRGLMLEACVAVTDFWFDTLGRKVLRAPKAAANIRSRRISERTGMRLIETNEKKFVSGFLPTDLWEITRDEWRGRPKFE